MQLDASRAETKAVQSGLDSQSFCLEYARDNGREIHAAKMTLLEMLEKEAEPKQLTLALTLALFATAIISPVSLLLIGTWVKTWSV